jgi:NADH-quinone oxidoreductase subunit N
MWLMRLSFLAPEIMMALGACIILIADLYTPKSMRWFSYVFTQITLLMTIYLLFNLWPAEHVIFFSGMFVLDNFALTIKIALLLFSMAIFLYARPYLLDRDQVRSEYFVLCLFSLLGMMILSSSAHFLSLYLGIELLVLPIYALIARFKEQPNAIEAAMKYFVLGAIASGMMLYGISLLYGFTGHFNFEAIATNLLQETGGPRIAVLLGMVLVIAGIAFKIGAVPFHMWIPDIYQGSAICMTLFIAVLPKIAGVAMAIRVFHGAFHALQEHAQHVLLFLIIASLVVGNLGAIMQKNLKRMLGYSAIAHVGFLFMGLLVGQSTGYGPLLSYVFIYVFILTAAFGVMLILSKSNHECEQLQDLQGLSQQHPWLAFVMLIALFSLAGIPPTIGFYAKLMILQAVVNNGYLWLAVVGLGASVVGAFYYLRIVKLMYFDPPLPVPFPAIVKIEAPASMGHPVLFSVLHGLGLIGLSLFPAPLFTIVQRALGG